METTSVSNTFPDALAFVLKSEGGYVNDPADRGGATNSGVTQAVYDAFRTRKGLAHQSVRQIAKAEVEEIYRQEYYDSCSCDAMPRPLAIAVFDFAVNGGVGAASRMLQRLIGAAPDGRIGPKTLELISQACGTPDGSTLLVKRYLDSRLDYYDSIVAKRPANKRFIRGWRNRVAQLADYLDLA